MADEKKPDAVSSESTRETNELTDDDLDRVAGGLTLTPTLAVRTDLTHVSLGLATPLPDSALL